MLDADGSTDPAEIPQFLEPLFAGADFAKGSRFMAGGDSLDITPFRRRGNRVLNGMVNVLFGTRYTDLCYGYNAFWADVLPKINVVCDGFEVETLMNVRIAKAALTVAEVPSVEHERIHGVSKLHHVRDSIRVLRTILRERLSMSVSTASASSTLCGTVCACSARSCVSVSAADRQLRCRRTWFSVWSSRAVTCTPKVSLSQAGFDGGFDSRTIRPRDRRLSADAMTRGSTREELLGARRSAWCLESGRPIAHVARGIWSAAGDACASCVRQAEADEGLRPDLPRVEEPEQITAAAQRRTTSCAARTRS